LTGTRPSTAVVIGSGPNGLTAAIVLARAGCRVTVLEAAPEIGGGARSGELTLPGFVHDICSTVYPIGVCSPAFEQFPLARFGLQWVHSPAPLAHPLDDGTAVMLGHAGCYLNFAFCSPMIVGVSSCRVSFTDSAGVTHSVSVSAASLYEACVLAMAEFRRCRFTDAAPGTAARLQVAVEGPATTHELSVARVCAWLEGNGKTPGEQALKARLRAILS